MPSKLRIQTHAQNEFINVTARVQLAVNDSIVTCGICHIFVPHTTAGITLNETNDPSVARDILFSLDKLISKNDNYFHSEGNSSSHI